MLGFRFKAHRPDWTRRLWLEFTGFGWVLALGILKGNHRAELFRLPHRRAP